MIFLILFGPNTTMTLVVMTEIQTYVKCFVLPQEGYILMHDIVKNEYHRKRLDYKEERGW